MKKDELYLTEGHRLAFDALIRMVKGEEAIVGLRPRKIDGTTKRKFFEKLGLRGNYCYWCDCHTNKIENHPKCQSLDHMIPRRFGGPNSIFNIVLSCRECDISRGRETPLGPILKYYGVTKEELKKYL